MIFRFTLAHIRVKERGGCMIILSLIITFNNFIIFCVNSTKKKKSPMS